MRAFLTIFGTAVLMAAFSALALDPPKPASREKPTSTGVIAPAATTGPRVLGWDDLMPLAERNRPPPPPPMIRPLFDDESGPAAAQDGSTAVNASLDGEHVKLPGFVVPLAADRNFRVSEFLLVPYFGACIHTPPPPPNQIVYVKMQKPLPVRSMYDPVWVIGKLSTRSNATELATASYTLAGTAIEIYEEEP